MRAFLPNARFIKPRADSIIAKGRQKGRERITYEHNVPAQNLQTLVLSWKAYAVEMLEVYLNGRRMLSGYTLDYNTNTLIFEPRVTGTLLVLQDASWPESGPWIEIPALQFASSLSALESSPPTDRRDGPHIPTFCYPIVITQPQKGWVRTNLHRTKLLFCNNVGMYGKDSFTYALISDNGQISDYGCCEVRARDPDYVPPIRCYFLSKTKMYVQTDEGEELTTGDVGGNFLHGAGWFGESPARMGNPEYIGAFADFVLVAQGQDEDGDWYPVSEFYDEPVNLDVLSGPVFDQGDALLIVGDMEGDAVRFNHDFSTEVTCSIRLSTGSLSTANGGSGELTVITEFNLVLPSIEAYTEQPEVTLGEPTLQLQPQADNVTLEPTLDFATFSGTGIVSGLGLGAQSFVYRVAAPFEYTYPLLTPNSTLNFGATTELAISGTVNVQDFAIEHVPTDVQVHPETLLWEDGRYGQAYLVPELRSTNLIEWDYEIESNEPTPDEPVQE